MRIRLVVTVAFLISGLSGAAGKARPEEPVPAADAYVLEGTVVTMNANRDIVPNGRVLVRDGMIEAVWSGPQVPDGVNARNIPVIEGSPTDLIFPGLINLHDHPLFNVLPSWQAPSSHVQADRARPTGTEPYANRYQWNVVSVTSPPEYRRLVNNANLILTDPLALNLQAEVVKYAEARHILAGTTSIQGAPSHAAYDTLLARNVDNVNFGVDRVENRVAAIDTLTGAALTSLRNRIKSGQTAAWIAHLAEGVRDGDRRPGDTTSSRAEFTALKTRQLLSDATVIVHGVGLEAADYAEMAAALPGRADGAGDGRGAKLVWSPHSNLALYGRTANVYDAAEAGVIVSLGTDWAPSGSPNLLAELKVADLALRDPRLLAAFRDGVDRFATTGLAGDALNDAERALDQWLVEMVTINPAMSLKWDAQVGSIEPGKVADLVVVSRPTPRHTTGRPRNAYRELIDATERDVRLVMVGGTIVAGDVEVMHAFRRPDYEIVPAPAGCYEKAIDVTAAGVPKGQQTLSQIAAVLGEGLRALGGDAPPAGGGPAPTSNTYSYLKARFAGTAGMTDSQFAQLVLAPFFGLVDGRFNLEAIQLAPLLANGDDWWLATVAGRFDADGLTDDLTPPYARYAPNLNHVTAGGNVFEAGAFEQRWYESASCRY